MRATFKPNLVTQGATFVIWWVPYYILPAVPLQVGAVPDPGSHVCRGWLTLPFSPDWGQGHQLSDGQHTQTNRLQASLIVRPDFCLSSIVFIVMTSIQSPLSLVVEGEVPRAPTLCHQAVACWCNRAPPQARATFTRVLPPPLLPPSPPCCPSSGHPLSAQCPNSLSFFLSKSLSVH